MTQLSRGFLGLLAPQPVEDKVCFLDVYTIFRQRFLCDPSRCSSCTRLAPFFVSFWFRRKHTGARVVQDMPEMEAYN